MKKRLLILIFLSCNIYSGPSDIQEAENEVIDTVMAVLENKYSQKDLQECLELFLSQKIASPLVYAVAQELSSDAQKKTALANTFIALKMSAYPEIDFDGLFLLQYIYLDLESQLNSHEKFLKRIANNEAINKALVVLESKKSRFEKSNMATLKKDQERLALSKNDTLRARCKVAIELEALRTYMDEHPL